MAESLDHQIHLMKLQADRGKTFSKKLIQKAGVFSGASILDLGCGPGFSSIWLSQQVGNTGKIVGVDHSEDFLEYMNLEIKKREIKNISCAKVDLNQDEVPSEKFDFVFARRVLYFLKDSSKVIEKISKALKPGGKIIIIDFISTDNYFFPNSPIFKDFVQKMEKWIALSGSNLGTTLELPSQLRLQGIAVEHLETFSEVVYTSSPENFEVYDLGFKRFADRYVEQGLWNETQRKNFLEKWTDMKSNPDAYIISVPELGIVAKQ